VRWLTLRKQRSISVTRLTSKRGVGSSLRPLGEKETLKMETAALRSGIVGAAIVPHAPQLLSLPETEDKACVGSSRIS